MNRRAFIGSLAALAIAPFATAPAALSSTSKFIDNLSISVNYEGLIVNDLLHRIYETPRLEA